MLTECKFFVNLLQSKIQIMRNLIFIALIASLSLSAQQKEAPKFTLEGRLTKAVFYHDNGEIAQIGYFKNKKRHGNWISYYRTGKKSATGLYRSGLKTGQWFFWKENNLIEVIYKDNKIVNVLEWNNSEEKMIAVNE